MDEGYSVIVALEIVKKGFPYFDSGYWDGTYIFFHYLQAVSISLFWQSEWAYRLPSLFISFFNLFLVYRISEKLFSTLVARFTVLGLSLSYIFWAYWLQARYYAMLLMFYLLWADVLYDYLKQKTNRMYYLLLALSSLGLLFHIFFLLPFFITLIFGIFLFRRDLKVLGLLFIIAISILVIRSLYFSHFWSTTDGILQNISHMYGYILRYHGFLWSNAWIMYSSGFIFVPFLLIIWKNKIWHSIMGIVILFSMIAISVWVMFYGDRYMYFTIPFFYIFSIGGFITLLELFTPPRERKLMLLAFTLGFLIFWKTIFQGNSSYSVFDIFAPEPDFQSAYAYIESIESDKTSSKIVSAYPHMDNIYLHHSDGYLYIDETWLWIWANHSFYVRDSSNVFTKAPIIENKNQLESLSWRDAGSSYIVFDQLSENRIRINNPELYQYIMDNYISVFKKQDERYFIAVYKKK